MAVEIDPEPLIKRRMEKGLRQIDVARALNLSSMTIHRIESGEIRSPKSVKRYADYLGLKMKTLVREDR